MFGFLKKSAGTADKTLESAPAASAESAAPQLSWRERLKAGLARTRSQFGGKLKSIFSRGKVDEDLLEELEALLLTSDVGMEATQHLLDELKARAKRETIDTPEGIQNALADILHELLLPLEKPLDISAHRPYIIMIAGVNGAGKTTSIGKLAYAFQSQGEKVLLAAGDTFRAAARERRRYGHRAGAGQREDPHQLPQLPARPQALRGRPAKRPAGGRLHRHRNGAQHPG